MLSLSIKDLQKNKTTVTKWFKNVTVTNEVQKFVFWTALGTSGWVIELLQEECILNESRFIRFYLSSTKNVFKRILGTCWLSRSVSIIHSEKDIKSSIIFDGSHYTNSLNHLNCWTADVSATAHRKCDCSVILRELSTLTRLILECEVRKPSQRLYRIHLSTAYWFIDYIILFNYCNPAHGNRL